ncbi:hypothetical protein RZS08_60500, partial [Arthrospira platensis SPKY1]|nr:hypothetical protein [Arthrospira platensis SPKY1]
MPSLEHLGDSDPRGLGSLSRPSLGLDGFSLGTQAGGLQRQPFLLHCLLRLDVSAQVFPGGFVL